MASTTFIGESGDTASTWGFLRAPLFTCQIGISIPEYYWEAFVNDCWADYTKHDCGYLVPWSELLKARWFNGPYDIGGLGYSTYGTNIGANLDGTNVYLAVGISGMSSWYTNPPMPGTSKIYNPDWTIIGNSYDYESTKACLVGATVTGSIGGSSFSVIVNEYMFPADYTPNPNPYTPSGGGTYIGPWSQTPGGPGFSCTINSVTLP